MIKMKYFIILLYLLHYLSDLLTIASACYVCCKCGSKLYNVVQFVIPAHMSIIVHCIFSSEVSYISSYVYHCTLYLFLWSKLYKVVQFVISAHMSIIVHCIFSSEVSYIMLYNLSYQPICLSLYIVSFPLK